MRLASLTLLLLCGLPASAALAETIACPDLGQTVQVGACPSEEELRYTYMGYCGDNARMYDANKDDVCSTFENYRKLKNVVLWETADGTFSGYVSCELPAVQLKVAKAATLAVARQGSITRLVCGYGEGIVFSYRTRQACRPEGDGSCAADPAGCRASCQ
jgi:hypothetical protein